MSYRYLKLFTILIPTFIIGGFEFFRHSIFLHHLSMETGNYVITILTFLISYIFATWMFKTIALKNQRITNEREMRVIYEERERLAKELHDSIAQTLFLLRVHMKKGKHKEADSLVNSIDTQLRQAIFNLRMNPDEQVLFTNRIHNWFDEWTAVSGIDIETDIHFIDKYFTPADEIQLFAIIQEAFMNIRKHSGADSVRFKLDIRNEDWEMSIEDNGCGFDIAEIGTNHYGLSMLKERVEKIGAQIEIDSVINQGTNIILRGNKKYDESF